MYVYIYMYVITYIYIYIYIYVYVCMCVHMMCVLHSGKRTFAWYQHKQRYLGPRLSQLDGVTSCTHKLGARAGSMRVYEVGPLISSSEAHQFA